MKASTMPICLLCLLSACASRQPDHFYILTAQPRGTGERMAIVPTPVSLKVSLPSLVDRPEMVINTGAEGVIVLEHERWAAPLSDLVTQVLAQDMERRRIDLLVTGSRGGRSNSPALEVRVDIVEMSARKAGQVSIWAHWRILDVSAAHETVGSEEFSAQPAPAGYAGIAQALSKCLALLADRLTAQLPPADGR